MFRFFVLVFAILLPSAGVCQLYSYENNTKLPYYDPGSPGETAYASCKPGQFLYVISASVEPGEYTRVETPVCRDQSEVNLLSSVTDALKKYKDGNIVGGLDAIIQNGGVRSVLEANIGPKAASELESIITGRVRTDTGNCKLLSLVIPAKAKVIGYYLFALNPSGVWLKCGIGGGEQCGMAWMSFPTQFAPVLTENGQIHSVMFMNWKHDWTRNVKFAVLFTMPPGEADPIPIL